MVSEILEIRWSFLIAVCVIKLCNYSVEMEKWKCFEQSCRYRRSFLLKLFELFPFSEHVPTACARVDALRSHGYTAEALRLAIAIVRTLKQGQIQSQQRWQDQQDRLLVNCTSSGVARNIAQVPSATEGWIGHPLDPIGCLFDTLAEASLMPDDQSRIQYYFGNNRIIFRPVRSKFIGCVCIFSLLVY